MTEKTPFTTCKTLHTETHLANAISGSSWAHKAVTELRLSFRDYGNKARNDLGFRIARFAD